MLTDIILHIFVKYFTKLRLFFNFCQNLLKFVEKCLKKFEILKFLLKTVAEFNLM